MILLFNKIIKELQMLKKIIIGLSLVLIVAVASDSQKSNSEIDVKTENYILKLKLEIFELKEQNSELKNVIEQMELKDSNSTLVGERLNRAQAIVKLRRDLSSRREKYRY